MPARGSRTHITYRYHSVRGRCRQGCRPRYTVLSPPRGPESTPGYRRDLYAFLHGHLSAVTAPVAGFLSHPPYSTTVTRSSLLHILTSCIFVFTLVSMSQSWAGRYYDTTPFIYDPHSFFVPALLSPCSSPPHSLLVVSISHPVTSFPLPTMLLPHYL